MFKYLNIIWKLNPNREVAMTHNYTCTALECHVSSVYYCGRFWNRSGSSFWKTQSHFLHQVDLMLWEREITNWRFFAHAKQTHLPEKSKVSASLSRQHHHLLPQLLAKLLLPLLIDLEKQLRAGERGKGEGEREEGERGKWEGERERRKREGEREGGGESGRGELCEENNQSLTCISF